MKQPIKKIVLLLSIITLASSPLLAQANAAPGKKFLKSASVIQERIKTLEKNLPVLEDYEVDDEVRLVKDAIKQLEKEGAKEPGAQQEIEKLKASVNQTEATFNTNVSQRKSNPADQKLVQMVDAIGSKPIASINDGIVMVLMLAGKQVPDNFNARLEAVKVLGLLPAKFDKKEDTVMLRGDLAMMVARYLKPGGSFLYAICAGGRYSYKLLVFHEIMPPYKSEWDAMNGEELLEVVRLAENFKRTEK